MLHKIILNDLRRNGVVSGITILFTAAAAFLLALSVLLAVNLFGAIDTLMARARTPHFMQMHSGGIDRDRMAAFAEEEGNVEAWQIGEFLNWDSADLILGDLSLGGSIQDNGFTVQNGRFDYLPAMDGPLPFPAPGEVYLPLSLMKEGAAREGDTLRAGGMSFRVAGFIRDSQMNSTLASSKRFLINPEDFEALRPGGILEYLIEFRLKDPELLNQFQNDYLYAGLENNGPTVTWGLFRLMNALSDGLMIAVLLLVSLLVTAVAFLCIRFSLLAKIEEDYREIGIMKAVGLPSSRIGGIFLSKYRILLLLGCLAGYGLSLLLQDIFLRNIRLFMGEGEGFGASLWGILGGAAVYLGVILYVRKLLGRIRNISPARALRFGTSPGGEGKGRSLRLSVRSFPGVNLFLGIGSVLAEKKLYLTMFLVFIAASFIMIVPQNLSSTIGSRDFASYMGIGLCDIRIDIRQTGDIGAKSSLLAEQLGKDRDVARYALLTTRAYKAETGEGTGSNLKVELGDHTRFPVLYTRGKAPEGPQDIALSSLEAEELGLAPGDSLTLYIRGRAVPLRVCGTYSDITNGGMTAKASFTDDSADIMWAHLCVDLNDRAIIPGKIESLEKAYPFAKVTDLEGYIAQTFGSTIEPVRRASRMAVLAALVIAAAVTGLFMTMLTARDSRSIAVLRAIGFTGGDIRLQYAARTVFVLLLGGAAGTVLANTLGESLAGAIISSLGVSAFRFTVNPVMAYLVYPLLLILTVCLATLGGAAGTGKMKISDYIGE